MGTTSSGPQNGRQVPSERDTMRRERSVSLVARLKERSESMESGRGDYVVGTSHYLLRPNVRVEAYDTWQSTLTKKPVFRWRPARIRRIRNDCVLVAWDGYSERWDTWLPLREGKIRSPSQGPVVGPDGVLYQPMWTPEPPLPAEGDQIIVPVAAPLPVPRSRMVRAPAAAPVSVVTTEFGGKKPSVVEVSPPKQTRQSSLSRMRLSLFKKTSRSDDDDDNGDDAFSSADDGEQTSSSSDEEGKVEIALGEEKDDKAEEDEDRDEEREGENTHRHALESKDDFGYPPLIRRTISTTSSMIVETGLPQRTNTPPNLLRNLFRRPFQQQQQTEPSISSSTNHNKLREDKGDEDDAPVAPSRSTTGESSKSMLSTSKSTGSLPNNTSAPSNSHSNGSGSNGNNISGGGANKENSRNTTTSLAGRGQSGLANLGNTCFMNAVLQSLSHVPPLVERLLREVQPLQPGDDLERPSRPHFGGRNDILARALCALVRDQWKANPEKSRRPVEMKKIISERAPQFQGHRQHDAQELLVCLLDGLHECLNRINRRPTYIEIKPPKGLSEEELSYLYWDNYERGNDSFIKDLFCGQFMSRVKCLDCGHVSTSFDVFWDLSLSLPAPAAATNSNGGASQTPPNVQDLLRSFCEEETLAEDCGFKCEHCKQWPVRGATKQLSIAMRPRVLVLHLKRFSHDASGATTRKIATPVSFPLKNLRLDNESYDLVSVVNHLGSFASGHYTADVYNPMTKSWFHADDSNFTPTQRIGADAYLLFFVETNKFERAVKLLCEV